MSLPQTPPVWIATPKELTSLVQTLLRQPAIAVDTESNSLYAYREQVCLIQFSTVGEDYLVDPLALDDLSPLGIIFSNPKLQKVFHAAEYDLICLKRDFGFTVANLFDTRWAVRVLGYTGDGLERLLAERFDVHVNKKYQKANWGHRPLSDEQISYARLDTHYLLPLKDMLRFELDSRGLLQLAHEDFSRACSVEIPAAKPPLWKRIGNNHGFTPRELTILKELYVCRDRIAEELDRPSFKVIGDKQLSEIACMPPEYLDDLLGLGMSLKQVTRWGKVILQAVQKGQKAPLVKHLPAERPDEAYLHRLDALKAWRKKVARKMGVESDVVLPRSLMEPLAKANPRDMKDLSTLLIDSPWRMSHFGPQILTSLKG